MRGVDTVDLCLLAWYTLPISGEVSPEFFVSFWSVGVHWTFRLVLGGKEKEGRRNNHHNSAVLFNPTYIEHLLNAWHF